MNNPTQVPSNRRPDHEPRTPLSDDQLIAIADQFDSSGCAGAIHRYRMRRRDMIALLRSFSATVEGLIRDGAAQPPRAMHPNGGAWMIVYDDQDRKPETFSGHGAEDAAHRRFDQISGQWNAHLFARVGSNSRDALTKSGEQP